MSDGRSNGSRLGAAIATSAAIVALAALSALAVSSASLPAQGPASASPASTGPASTARELSADTTFFPEGLAVDGRDGTLYVTSLRHRTLYTSRAGGALQAVLDPRAATAARIGGVFGVVLDTARACAWITAGKVAFMAPGADDAAVQAELIELSLPDGRIVRRFTLGDGTGMPGEIARGDDGTILVSDGMKARLHRLRPGASSLETVQHPLLRSPQGIAIAPDGRTAWVADYSRGILRWDLATDSLAQVTLADGSLVRGVDGLRWWRGRLIAVHNGTSPNRVFQLSLSDDGLRLTGASVIDRPPPIGESTVGALVGDRFLYVASSQWPFWTEGGARKPDAGALPRVVVRDLPLRP